MTTYQIDTLLQLTTTFTNDATGGTVDPTNVTLYLKKPGADVVTYTYSGGALQRLAPGVYAYDLTTDTSGRWYYKWQGAGSVDITTPDLVFDVQPSRLIAG